MHKKEEKIFLAENVDANATPKHETPFTFL